jgi:hypothetical protein
MQNSNQTNQQQDTVKKDDQSKESAWKGSSPEDVTGKQQDSTHQANPNKAMGNAANRGPQNQDQTNRPGQNKTQKDDADEMGSGKRQDDN